MKTNISIVTASNVRTGGGWGAGMLTAKPHFGNTEVKHDPAEQRLYVMEDLGSNGSNKCQAGK